MTHLPSSFRNSILLIAAFSITISTVAPAQSPTETTPVRWAIAIHGGAGGSPDRWSDEKRAARTEGLRKALTIGRDMLAAGQPSLDVVQAVIETLEDDPNFNAGRGAVLNTDGKAELDASIMDGRDGSCGAVAAVTTVKNPIRLANLVMTQTPHVLLVNHGAESFAKQKNIQLVAPEYFLSAVRPSPPSESYLGTVGCVARDTHGHLAAGTSTGGTTKKLPGRVGDSPIIGAGTYADDRTCAVSGTGIGEEYIRHAVAYDISAQMQYAGHSLEQAVTDVMVNRLRPNDGGLISVSSDGEIVIQHNTPALSGGAADSDGRFETFLSLENGGRSVPEKSKPNQPETTEAENQIRQLIQQQAVDWNRGDLDGFMSVYWKNQRLTFSSGGQTTRGWDATLDRYRTRYPDRATMGRTTFSDLEFFPLDDDAMQVLGRWKLDRDTDPVGGNFTLVFRRIDGQWRIVHDHTSVEKNERD